ncbi:RagB/SusD family nutrient uptake outer membrane protein [Flavobacterium sp.]|uniref:RagB/SusD family nutrient uptake outer membrane protein n=1 Tax=Flavobacterium sp. TaxID=239 RepID=UPI002CD2F423|nr:RagB/SusD family nutrient uptake outer membrane protein [Flavobacterium sp.]MCA0349351.1 RagB/SusD family nutrient uptake outer membrane protein [Bacteroidota bacterium]HQA73466.1 RagB/SusD family nutrient uptake outer membrane protein [Flavobacterium sp.]
MKIIIKKIAVAFLFVMLFNSCSSELDTKPVVEQSFENLLLQDPNAAKGLLSRMYATFALTGSNGPGSSDIVTNDAGESGFLRGIINLQDLTTDNVKNRWGDDGLDQLTTTSNWTQNNKFFRYLFDRVYYTVPQTTNLIIALQNTNVSEKAQYISELRFLRSLAYYYMIDCFGKGVLVTTENYGTISPLPEASRTDLFDYVESELLAIENDLPFSNEYGRANKSACRMLLAKLYLNAEVYTGVSRYNDALIYSNKVITEGGFSLAPNYLQNFTADNNTSPEIIFPLIADALTSQSYGNTTYLVNASMNADTMPISLFGATDGWGGNRATKAWYGLFGDLDTSTDARAQLFWRAGHTYEMTDYKTWTNGYPSTKFRNSMFTGTSSPTSFSSTDFPMFRLADAYLIYAESVLRGATSGSSSQALSYVNELRARSNASSISQSQLTLDFILDERGRELNMEGQRRTDLIRFGKFTGGDYLWPWKGNSLNGVSIPDTYKVFPLPLSALDSNPNLTQNTGY